MCSESGRAAGGPTGGITFRILLNSWDARFCRVPGATIKSASPRKRSTQLRQTFRRRRKHLPQSGLSPLGGEVVDGLAGGEDAGGVTGTSDHVLGNRVAWDRLAADYAGPGRLSGRAGDPSVHSYVV